MSGNPCLHGDIRAACIDCLEGPRDPATIPAGAEQLLPAVRFTTARYDGRCARNLGHELEAGERIGYVEAVGGWCCTRCCA